MNPLVFELNRLGISALRVTLTAHEGSPEHEHAATPERWVEDVRVAYCAAREFPGVEAIYNLSFSLGSAVTTLFLDRHEDAYFTKMIFLAPALRLQPKTVLVRFLTALRIFDLSVPSVAPVAYRDSDSTSLHSYAALFGTVDAIRHLSGAERLARIPTLLLMSAKDRLVSHKRIKRWIREHRLNRWQMEFLFPKAETEDTIPHLAIDRATLGKQEWERMKLLIGNHLNR